MLAVVTLMLGLAVSDVTRGVDVIGLACGVGGITLRLAIAFRETRATWRYVCGTLIAAAGTFGVLGGSVAATVTIAAGVAVVVGTFPPSAVGMAASLTALVMAGAAAWLSGWQELRDSSGVVVPFVVGMLFGLRGLEAAREGRRRHALHRVELRAAAAEERARLGRDLHDVLAHSLGALVIQLEALDTVIEHGGLDTDIRLRVKVVRDLAVTGLIEGRQAVHALRRFTEPVEQVLNELAGELAVQEWGHLTVTTTGLPRPLSAPVVDFLGALAVEAVSNIRRHASAATAYAEVVYLADRVIVRLSNDATKAPGPEGRGLRGLHERAKLASARLTTKWDGQAWELCCEVTD